MTVHDLTGDDGILERTVCRPDGSKSDVYTANGDGTWEHMTLDAAGAQVSVETVEELPDPDAALSAALAAVEEASDLAALRSATAAYLSLLTP